MKRKLRNILYFLFCILVLIMFSGCSGAIKEVGLMILGIVLVVGLLIVFGLLINMLGGLAANSSVWKWISVVVLSFIGILFLGGYSVRDNPFVLLLNIDTTGHIQKVEIGETPIDLSLKFSANKENIVTYEDKRGRVFSCVLPAKLSPGVLKLRLVPQSKILVGLIYVIVRINKVFYVILTPAKFAAMLASMVAVFLVWGAGHEGKVAFLSLKED